MREEDGLDSVTITRKAGTGKLIEARKVLDGVDIESITPCLNWNYCYICRESEYGNVKQYTYEKEFWFLKAPMFYAESLYFNSPRRIMALIMVMVGSSCVLSYREKDFSIENKVKKSQKQIDHPMICCKNRIFSLRGAENRMYIPLPFPQILYNNLCLRQR
ncbi:hypothetical protein [Sediminispirochaeta bajacaliforniensis]|uniref:hypothetical protein n=1 Tax=Sediminispirochaeta bajacaliforniensis TaxID=148 RepID=UPI00035D4246|nr:hypothetical protein [Sediminispirochaeta bajacaliforniensis]